MDHMHDDMPPVTVVVVNHNAGPLLADCLRAALAQTRQVVLVDNASEPRPVDDVLGCFPAHSDFDVVRCPVNAGFAAGCNRGLALAREPILLFLNPDCILAAGAVAALVRALGGEAHIGMVGGLLTDEQGFEQGGSRRAVPTPWRSFVRGFGLTRFSSRWPRLFSDFNLHGQPLPTAPIDVEAVSGACTMVTRQALDDVGTTADNLRGAIAGETHEYTDMYPGMAKTARNEGFEEIADWFETLAKAEKSHAGRFQKALDSLD